MAKTACTACPLRNREIFVPFSAAELAFMRSFKTGELAVDAGTTILMEGSKSPQLYTVLSGLGTRFKTLENGKVQVINFLFPGDFTGLQGSLMGEMKHSVKASTQMTLCAFRREDIWGLFRSHPERAYDLTWIAAVEEHFLGETIASLGQRDAIQRISWALLRIHERLSAVGLFGNGAVPLPFRQQDLADALGLSLVHTNKTLKQLWQRKWVQWTNGKVKIDDPAALAKLAMIDLEKPERRPLM
jgi:CRP-like cAMP-binding protein